MKTLSRLLLSVILFVGFLADSSFGKAFGPRAASPAAFSATNAAWYSLAGSASDSTYLLSGGNVTLIADRSGNSAVNGLVLNGGAANNASSPDSAALSVTGDIDVRWLGGLNDWTPSGEIALVGKYDFAVNKRCYGLFVDTAGKLILTTSANGTSTAGQILSATSTIAVPVADFGVIGVRATRDVDNGAGGATTTFYTSNDFQAWTQLGDPVVSAFTTSIFDSDIALTIGSILSGGAANEMMTGVVRRVQIYNGIAGTLAFDANFTTQAKLATSFTESSSNAATVTINTSGDLGARISGARDLVQLTASKQPAFSVVGGYNTATFDGSNDYMKSQAWSQPQPSSFYVTMSQVTWTDTDYFWDSFTSDAASAFQRTSTPGFQIYSGGASTRNDNLPVATKGIISALYSGAASTSRVNLGATIAGASVGTAAAGGFCVGAASGGSAPGNITFNEALIRSAADDATTQNALTAYEMLTWGITP